MKTHQHRIVSNCVELFPIAYLFVVNTFKFDYGSEMNILVLQKTYANTKTNFHSLPPCCQNQRYPSGGGLLCAIRAIHPFVHLSIRPFIHPSVIAKPNTTQTARYKFFLLSGHGSTSSSLTEWAFFRGLFGTKSMFGAVSLGVHYLLDSFRPALAKAFYIQLVVDVLANAPKPHPKLCRSLLPWGCRSSACLPESNP